jgi:hypothetical protein
MKEPVNESGNPGSGSNSTLLPFNLHFAKKFDVHPGTILQISLHQREWLRWLA